MSAAQVVRLSTSIDSVPLLEAVEAFLAERDLTASSRPKYRATLALLVDGIGADVAVAEIPGRRLVRFLNAYWGEAAPATWNRHRATLRSFFGYCRRQRWLVDDPTEATERRHEPDDETGALPYAELERLWARRDVPLRERALFRLLYESAGRAQEVLDVGDVDLPSRQAVVTGKGGHREIVHFQTGSARLLARLVGGRRRGPVFLAAKRPAPSKAPAAVDVDPGSGLARLSYRREELFVEYSGGRTSPAPP